LGEQAGRLRRAKGRALGQLLDNLLDLPLKE
jgi:hypothetical protein